MKNYIYCKQKHKMTKEKIRRRKIRHAIAVATYFYAKYAKYR